MEVTLSYPYSAATQFGGVTDWYLEPRGFHGHLHVEDPYAYVKVAMQEQPPPDFVPKPVYLEFMPLEDDEDPKEDDEDLEEDPADYPTNKDDGEEEEKSSRDDIDDEEEDEDKDEEEEEEHLAPADSFPPLAYRTTARMSI
ncbi:hypothetical protein Tco_0650002 [Tanacetum coccineum]